jgi:hypothetical protein
MPRIARLRLGATVATMCLLLTVVSVFGIGGGVVANAAPMAVASATPAVATCPSTTVHFAKTKFLLHAGLAAGAFHRYIYEPLRYQRFSKGAEHRVAAFVKAAAATAYIVHELRLANQDAHGSKTLCRLVSPLNGAIGLVSSMANKIKNGTLKSTDVTSANSLVGQVAAG